jgi:hypothetical protein
MANMLKKLYNIHLNVYAISVVSFLMQFGATLVYSTGNVVVKDALISASSLVLLRIVSESLSTILKVFSGYFSDVLHNRKVFLIAGNLSMIFLKIMFLITTMRTRFSIHFLSVLYVITQILDRLMNSIRDAPRDALMVESIEDGDFAFAFSLRKVVGSLGTILGCLTAFLIVRYNLLSYTALYTLAIIPVVLANIILYKFVKNIDQNKKSNFIIKEDRVKIDSTNNITEISDESFFSIFQEVVYAEKKKAISYKKWVLSFLNIWSVVLCIFCWCWEKVTKIYLAKMLEVFHIATIVNNIITWQDNRKLLQKKIESQVIFNCIDIAFYMIQIPLFIFLGIKCYLFFFESRSSILHVISGNSINLSLLSHLIGNILPSLFCEDVDATSVFVYPILSAYLCKGQKTESVLQILLSFAFTIAFLIRKYIFSKKEEPEQYNSQRNRSIGRTILSATGYGLIAMWCSLQNIKCWQLSFSYYDTWNGPISGCILFSLWLLFSSLDFNMKKMNASQVLMIVSSIVFKLLSTNIFYPDMIQSTLPKVNMLRILGEIFVYFLLQGFAGKDSILLGMTPAFLLNTFTLINMKNWIFILHNPIKYIFLFFVAALAIKNLIQRSEYKVTERKHKLVVLILLSSLFSFAKSNDTLFFNEAEKIGFKKEFTILTFMLIYVSIAIFSPLYSYLMTRGKRKHAVLAMCYSLLMSNMILISNSGSKSMFLLSILLLGMFSAGIDPVMTVLISENTPKNFKGTIFGITFSIAGLLAISNGLIASKWGLISVLKICCIPLMAAIPISQII